MPSGVHFQVIESCTPGYSWMFCILIHKDMNSSRCVAVVILPLRDRIPPSFWSSCWTDLFFLLTSSKSYGARFLGASPSSQLWCQNCAFVPFPTVTMVDALNNNLSVGLQGNSEPAHGLEGSTQSYHNQRNRSALPNLSRSGTPRPPSSLGLDTVGQLTRQCPPFAFSSPFHRKDLRILSICFLAQAASGKTVRWYVGIDERTEVTNVSRPALFSSLPFQPGNLWPIRSIRGCTCTFWSGLVCNCRPR
jgi:hypothetical protein